MDSNYRDYFQLRTSHLEAFTVRILKSYHLTCHLVNSPKQLHKFVLFSHFTKSAHSLISCTFCTILSCLSFNLMMWRPIFSFLMQPTSPALVPIFSKILPKKKEDSISLRILKIFVNFRTYSKKWAHILCTRCHTSPGLSMCPLTGQLLIRCRPLGVYHRVGNVWLQFYENYSSISAASKSIWLDRCPSCSEIRRICDKNENWVLPILTRRTSYHLTR